MEHSGPPIFKAWVIFVIFANLLGFLAGAAAGFVVGLILAAVGHGELDKIRLASQIAGFLAGLAVSFFVFQRVVNRVIVPNVWPPRSDSQPAIAIGQSPVVPPHDAASR